MKFYANIPHNAAYSFNLLFVLLFLATYSTSSEYDDSQVQRKKMQRIVHD